MTYNEIVALHRRGRLIKGKIYQDKDNNKYKVNSKNVLEKVNTEGVNFEDQIENNKIHIGLTPPTNPKYGKLWIDTN